jgi:predicted Zn-dependent peptidase
MFRKLLGYGILTVILLALVAGPVAAKDAATLDTLDNGMELILVENHSSPLIASVIFVQSGSKYESEYENGITHFLEHLLFSGTTHLSGDEIWRTIRNMGGGLYAFTGEDITGYQLTVPRERIEYALTLQADMLFNSTFPEEEVACERKIVIEEINGSNDRLGAATLSFFTGHALANTGYERPILGYESLIANIPRGAVVAYWKEHYTPNKMTALVIGDFETSRMRAMLENILGCFESPVSPDQSTAGDLHRTLANAKGRAGQIVGQHRFDTAGPVRSIHIQFSVQAPKIESPDYLPFDLLTRYLDLDKASPLHTVLATDSAPVRGGISTWLEPHHGFSRMRIAINATIFQSADSIIDRTVATLVGMGSHQADSVDIVGLKTSARCEAVYSSEDFVTYPSKVPHLLALTDWNWVETYPEWLDSVTWEQCRSVAAKWLDQPNYVVTVMTPTDSL